MGGLVFSVLYICLVGLLAQQLPVPTEYIGVGYNVLKGNPDGGASSHSGTDPGLLYARKIFKLSIGSGGVPNETTFAHHGSCQNVVSERFIYNTHAYRDALLVDVHADIGPSPDHLLEHAFSLSQGYGEIQQATEVHHKLFRDVQTVCNFARLRYKTELALLDRFSVTREFAAAVCDLPFSYDQNKYFKFIEMWGTHVVVEVDSGIRTLERYEITSGEFFDYATKYDPTLYTVQGAFAGFNESIVFKTAKLSTIRPLQLSKGTLYKKIVSGTNVSPAPIGLKISRITEALQDKYWQGLEQMIPGDRCLNLMRHSYLGNISSNLNHALESYASMKNASNISGSFAETLIQRHFCIKSSEAPTAITFNWQPGSYCIYKKGTCPAGFSIGHMFWDDKDNTNTNKHGGVLPDGTYNGDTSIDFCCRTDGSTNSPLVLPTSIPFILLRNGASCQKVQGADEKEMFIFYQDSTTRNGDTSSGAIPFDDAGAGAHKIHYCYYQKISGGSSVIFG